MKNQEKKTDQTNLQGIQVVDESDMDLTVAVINMFKLQMMRQGIWTKNRGKKRKLYN